MATAGTPVTPGTYVGVTPGANQFGAYQAQALAAYKTALLNTQAQRGQFLQNSGLTGQYDPTTGALTGENVGTDPMGSYQQMLAQMAGNADQTDANNAGTGFSGGLAAQANDQEHMADSAQSGAWGSDVLNQLSGFGAQDQSATQDYNNGLYQQMLQNVQDGIANGQYNPGDMTGVNVDQYGNPTSPAPWKPPTATPIVGKGKGNNIPVPRVGTKTSHYGNWSPTTGRWVPWKPAPAKKKGGK